MNEWLYNELKNIFERVYYDFPLEEVDLPYCCFSEVSHEMTLISKDWTIENKRFQIDYYAKTYEECLEAQNQLINWIKNNYGKYPFIEHINTNSGKEGDIWRMIFEIRIHYRR